jgi:hypothetical protein
MALTVILALVGSLALSLTPHACPRGASSSRAGSRNGADRGCAARWAYRPILRLERRRADARARCSRLRCGCSPAASARVRPRLSEGPFAVNVIRLAGT